jgi:hypothetical protein
VSESGGNASVRSTYAGELNIQDNAFTNNWSGVVIYQNANRHSGDGQDPGTLTPPTGVDAWIKDARTICPAHLSQTSPIDYNALCQWRAQNVTVQQNTFTFSPASAGYTGHCTEANACGQNALFSIVSSTSAYPGVSVCNDISNKQDNQDVHVLLPGGRIGPGCLAGRGEERQGIGRRLRRAGRRQHLQAELTLTLSRAWTPAGRG